MSEKAAGEAAAAPLTEISIRTANEGAAKRPYSANAVSTTKYSIFTWLPRSIFAQFRRVANVYFLGISILMIIGTYAPELFTTPLDYGSTVFTLIFVLMVTSVKEGYEDVQRAKSDRYENTKEVTVVTFKADGTTTEKKIASSEVCPGDVVKLVGTMAVPVDLLLVLTAHHDDGNKCYIETANLDGETNLKLKEAPSGLIDVFTAEVKAGVPCKHMFEGKIVTQAPNKNMHKFEGTWTLGTIEDISLSTENLVLRGSVFSNTDWGYGIAIYTGPNTKMQMNSRQPPTKMSKIEGYLNSAIIIIFWAQCILVSVSVISIYGMGFQHYSKKTPYITGSESVLPYWLEQWITFFLLYNNFIPISLYVTIEMVNIGQAFLIGSDIHLYNADLDVPCTVRSSNLVQELGGVSNIFSDKTGTLTRNEMKLVKFVLNNKIYDVTATEMADMGLQKSENSTSEESPNDSPTLKASNEKKKNSVLGAFGNNKDSFTDFCRCLVTCHTVVRESDGTYRAESPDELALVESVGNYGCYLQERGSKEMSVSLFGESLRFETLAVNAFDSDRKRMSVLLRDVQTGAYTLMCKGADNIMLPLCAVTTEQRVDIDLSLELLSNLGLRTLVVAKKELTDAQAVAWLATWKAASTASTGREEKLAAAGGAVELDMDLVGLTAIEDRLQDEVPEVIAELASAGIVLWMLTGDKLETAINIGRSCNLILESTNMVRLVNLDTPQLYFDALKRESEAISPEKKSVTALVMDGPSFSNFNDGDPEQRAMMLHLAANCRSVVACRLTPTQKKELVSLVKMDTFPRTTTLSIGDGANDVSMIMEADVGVGIFGKEGRQAANNADFAIGEFKFLRRLLLVHGRWNYVRQSQVFLYSMHKNMVLTLTLFWFGYYDAVSGTSIYESWIYSSFNLILGLPIIFFGFLDRDISADFAIKYPQTYEISRKNGLLQNGDIMLWIMNAVMYATIICLTFYTALYQTNVTDTTLYVFGTIVFTGLCNALQLKILFMQHQWAYPQCIVMAISVMGMFLCYAVVQDFFGVYDYIGVADSTFEQSLFWCFGFFFVPLMCMYVDALEYYVRLLFAPTLLQLMREVEHHDYFAANWMSLSPAMRASLGLAVLGGSDVPATATSAPVIGVKVNRDEDDKRFSPPIVVSDVSDVESETTV